MPRALAAKAPAATVFVSPCTTTADGRSMANWASSAARMAAIWAARVCPPTSSWMSGGRMPISAKNTSDMLAS